MARQEHRYDKPSNAHQSSTDVLDHTTRTLVGELCQKQILAVVQILPPFRSRSEIKHSGARENSFRALRTQEQNGLK